MASNMVPHEELPVLEAFINIRNRLTALKKVDHMYHEGGTSS